MINDPFQADIKAKRAEQREHHRALLCRLIENKFGSDRGAITAACQACGVLPGNMSQMMKGSISIPKKYLEALEQMPDYVPPEQTPIPPRPQGDGWYLSVKISMAAHDKLHLIRRAHTAHNSNPPQTPEAVAFSMEKLIEFAYDEYVARGWLDFAGKKVAFTAPKTYGEDDPLPQRGIKEDYEIEEHTEFTSKQLLDDILS